MPGRKSQAWSSSVQFAVNILTIISFAAHALLGCCIHHQHGQSQKSARADVRRENLRVASASAFHACGCQHHIKRGIEQSQNENSGSGEHGPVHPVPCEEQSCAFSIDPSARDELEQVVCRWNVLVAETPVITSDILLECPGAHFIEPGRCRQANRQQVLAELQAWLV